MEWSVASALVGGAIAGFPVTSATAVSANTYSGLPSTRVYALQAHDARREQFASRV